MNEETTYSHPESPVRQSYPLVVKEKGLMAALNLCLKTFPFMGMRLALMMGFTGVTFLWFCLTIAVTGAFSRAVSGPVGFLPLLIGFGLPFGAFQWFKKYVLYILKIGHIAVLTRLITHGDLDPNTSQISYGKEIVTEHFGELNLLLVLDGLIHGVVNAFTGTLDWMVHLLPLPGVDGPLRMIRSILNNATRYIGETIFSYNLARGDNNKWRSSKDGLIYYAQNWKPILKTAVYALALEYAITFGMFLLFLVPAFGLSALMPRIGVWVVIFAGLLALNFKAAVLRPIFLTMVMLTYHEAIYNQPINLEWDQNLTGVSEKFKELSERAKSWVAEKTPLPAPGAPATRAVIS